MEPDFQEDFQMTRNSKAKRPKVENPFHDLWITEYLNPEEFVQLFSPLVADDSEQLFSSGNVVVKGRQGSGKSMLLSLLETRTRIAYARQNVPYPAKRASHSFISAGVNLTRDNAKLVVSRIIEIPEDKRRNWAATTFADFVNYLLSINLLEEVLFLAREQSKDGVLADELPVNLSADREAILVSRIVGAEEWYGYLDGCSTVDEIIKRCRTRLTCYRKYFNFNGELPGEVETSKTEIGQPVAIVADALRSAGVLDPSTLVLLRLDQHEELYVLEKLSGYGDLFRQVINRALAARDSRISYRIGTRHYAWSERTQVWGSGASIENLRDYVELDIDEYFRRNENLAVKWRFPPFAEDVFRRRLSVAGYVLDGIPVGRTLDAVFGDTMLPQIRSEVYAKGAPPKLKFDSDWSAGWVALLSELWKKDPLSARLGEAYLRQRAQRNEGVALRDPPKNLPWEAADKRWWKKERVEVAAMQIASECNQSLIWSGRKHVLELAGWNILPFMTICKTIWAAWIRNADEQSLACDSPPSIGMAEQTVGVLEASKIWLDKVGEGVSGERRKALVTNVGAWFYSRLRSDRSISYPGANGFSLLMQDFETKDALTSLLRECKDQGDLVQFSHTTKLSNSQSRVKWYLNPILTPFFRIPQIRTKEPIYTDLTELRAVLAADPKSIARSSDRSLVQGGLF